MLITRGLNKAGILSAGIYKAYTNDILNTLERSDMGFKIGTSYVGCPTCADDIMLCDKSKQKAQIQLYIIEQCTSNDRVKINSKKTEIIRINDNKATNKPLTHFKETISEKTILKALRYRTTEEQHTGYRKTNLYSKGHYVFTHGSRSTWNQWNKSTDSLEIMANVRCTKNALWN